MTESPSSQATPRSLIVAGLFAALLAGTWYFGEWDKALVGYAVFLVVAVQAASQRLFLWLERPSTEMYFKRFFFDVAKARFGIAKRSGLYFGANLFVWKRSPLRWGAHWPIMIGCLMALSIVMPLILGVIWFEAADGDMNHYTLHVMHIPLQRFAVDGFFAFMLFHGLVWASIPVVIGCGMAILRRVRDRGDQAVQNIGYDFAPLIALLGISFTGLALAVSNAFFDGAGYIIWATMHAAVVGMTLLWFAYSKLFHVAQRSLKFAQIAYDHNAQKEGPAICARCGSEFSSKRQIADLKIVEEKLGFQYHNLGDSNETHYQDICPACRRAMLVTAQGRRWQAVRPAAAPLPTVEREEQAQEEVACL